MTNYKTNVDLIWRIAELLRGDYKQSDYGKVILPLTVLRRLDCILQPTKQKVMDKYPKVKGMSEAAMDVALNKVAGYNFHNHSRFDFDSLIADPENIGLNLRNYINGFSASARAIIEYFNFDDQIDRMDDPQADILFQVVKSFQEVDLANMDSMEMGYVFEDLIRRFSEQSNETAGEHFTPREVIRLMVNLLFVEDREILTQKGIVKTMYDPACGTGGMLSVADQYVNELNPDADLKLFGQEINPESYAICKSDMLIKGENPGNVKFGNTFLVDGLENEKFDYMLSNPPFGVEWKKAQKVIKAEYENKGMSGRFGAGLPRINDGSFLFLQHMISKMKPTGTRIGIVFNGSPLFSGAADSGESNIRKWIIENDWLEAIVALPDQLFYNTGIATYIWIITNKKEAKRRGKVQLINATGAKDEELIKEGKLVVNRFWQKMDRSLGNKRKRIVENGNDKGIGYITQLYGDFVENENSKIYPNEYFGYWRIVVEQPLIEDGKIVTDRKGNPKPDTSKRDYENIPFLVQTKSINDNSAVSNSPNPLPVKTHRRASLTAESEGRASLTAESEGRASLTAESEGRASLTAEFTPQTIEQYFTREVQPHLPDAWIEKSKTKVGYEINFTKYFYEFKPLRSLEEIRADILALEEDTLESVKNVLD